MKKVVAIHQPNFLPWLGFIDKFVRSDVFILLDDVQFPKKGGSWTNRVRLLVGGKPAWITVPIDRSYHGTRRIDEMVIKDQFDWRGKILGTIRMSYGRAPCFQEISPWLERLINHPTSSLAEFNVAALDSLVRGFGWRADKFVLGSSLGVTASATERLVELAKAVGGTTYLCGGGTDGYQEDDLFPAAGIELEYQEFDHPDYPQFNTPELVPGLSVVDLLMNCGFAGARDYLA